MSWSVVRRTSSPGCKTAHPRRRMIATACYLIDALCLRVGDEKDPDEADTVGATTLRPEHVKLHERRDRGIQVPGQGFGGVAQED